MARTRSQRKEVERNTCSLNDVGGTAAASLSGRADRPSKKSSQEARSAFCADPEIGASVVVSAGAVHGERALFTTRSFAAWVAKSSARDACESRRLSVPSQIQSSAPTWPANESKGAVMMVTDVAGSALFGIALAFTAWSPGRSSAMGLLFPMLWVMSISRVAALVFAAAYAMTVVRFLPNFAGNWFDSPALGWACWIGVGIASGGLWGLLWPAKSNPLRVAVATFAALVLSLMSPVGALFPGHPVASWGFAWPGSGWLGIAALSLGTATAAAALRLAASLRNGTDYAWLALAIAAIALAVFGIKPDPQEGGRAGSVVGINTAWGGFPSYGSLDVAERLRRIGATVDSLYADAALTLVFPEAILGLYDSSLDDAIELEIGRKIRRTGQTVVLGADMDAGGGRFVNAALVLHPDGTRSIVAARQTTPVAQWRPWSRAMHFPANWLSDATVTLGDDRKARIMFCHEEWMPALHLLSEAREGHQVVIAMANLWAAADPLANDVQAAHTQGMALLFGSPFVRSVNLPSARAP